MIRCVRVPCLDGISNHPRIGWPTSRADEQGPGAPATQSPGGCPPARVNLQTGAPAPETASDARGGDLPERSPGQDAVRNRGASDHPILKFARAC